jgi:DNA-directed RNA polymerase specialized sigma24 family protein
MIPQVSLSNAKIIKLPKRLKDKPDKLPWPRFSDDEDRVMLGVDVVAKQQDIIKLVHKFFKVESYQMEELLQEVYVAIIHKNQTRSAHDPRKSSFGHYIYMVSNNVCINIVNRKRRYDRESESLDSPVSCTDNRLLLDTIEDPDRCTDGDKETENTREIELLLRKNGYWDSARYIRATSTGAKPEIIREALTFGDRKVTNKTIRDYRNQLKFDVSSVMQG